MFKHVLGNVTLIILLFLSKLTIFIFLVSFSRISLNKFPYWTISLCLIYYSLAYKYTLNQFDLILKRKLVKIQKRILGFILVAYSGVMIMLKLALGISYFINPNNPFLNNKFIKIELLVIKENESNFNTVVVETLLEIFIFINAIVTIVISDNKNDKNDKNEKSENLDKDKENQNSIKNGYSNLENESQSENEAQNDLGENQNFSKNIENNLNNLEFLYTEYKLFKANKFFHYILQFIFISVVIIFNISILNLQNFIIFTLMTICTILHSFKYMDITNKVFSFLSFITINFIFYKNIDQFRNEKEDNLNGVAILNFNKNDIINTTNEINTINTIFSTNFSHSLLFFSFYILSYINSCIIQKYDKIQDELNLFNTENNRNILQIEYELKRIKENFDKSSPFIIKLKKTIKNSFTQISSLSYNLILLFSILFHVCILQFINFLFLFFSISSNKKKSNFYYTSFIMSLLYTTLQYVFNMTGVFLFSNPQMYKWLEIVGVSKYYRSKLMSDYSNVNLLDKNNEDKIKGMAIDMILIILLTLFACGIRQKNKKEEMTQNEENLNEIPQTENLNKCITFSIEKSFIFCLIFLFACSIVKFDMLHVIYFAFFIILLVVNSNHFKSVWDFVLLVNSIIIIIVLYFWNILALNFLGLENEMNPVNENIFSYLGLKITKNSIFFVEYWEHILLYLFGYIHKYFINNSLEKFEVKNLYKFPEWTRIITLFLCIVFMLILAVIKPLSFQGLFFLGYSLVFISAYMFILSEDKNKVVRTLIRMLILFGIILIIMKYSINFSFLVKYLKDSFDLEDNSIFKINSNFLRSEENDNSFNNIDTDNDSLNIKNFSLQDFGLDSMNLNFKLMINAMLIIIAKILNQYDKYNEEDNIEHIENRENENINTQNMNHNNTTIFNINLGQTSNKISSYLKIFLYQLIYLHSTKIMFIVSVFICVSLESMMGVIFFGIILISLFLELKSGWKYSFFPLIFLSIIVMCFIYLCNLNAFKKWMTKDYEWFGLYNTKSNSTISSDLLPYLIIVFSAFLTRISSTFKHYYKEVEDLEQNNLENVPIVGSVKSEEDLSESKNLRSYENSEEKEIENKIIIEKSIIDNKNNKEEVQLIDENFDIKNVIESDKNMLLNNSNTSQYLKMNFSSITAISSEKYEEEIIINLSKFWNKIDYFWYLYGFYFVLVAIMLVAFIKVNVLSLIFMTFVGFQSFGIYLRCEYLTRKEEENAPNLKRIKRNWIWFAGFLALFTFLQYLNYMWFPPSWKIAKPWENFTFFCAKEGKTIYSNKIHFKNTSDYEYCVADWKAWLNIDNYGTKDIFYNFICLFLLLISHKYFTSHEMFSRKRFEEEKVIDFTITENRKDFGEFLSYFLFIYLKSFILIYIIIISILYSYRYTNLIYGGFMFISFYLLFKDAALVKQKNNLWKYVQYYNYLVLVAFMLFQTPFLPCPVNRDGRSYIGLEECVEEENRLYQSFLLYEYPKNKVDALYMVMVQTIGVLKLDFKLLVVGNLSLFLIYIVALIQQIIFEHPYQSIIDKYYFREKQINCKSRAFKFVQDSHLNTHTEYRQLFTFMEILKGKLERLGKRIVEYGDLWKRNFEFSNPNDENEKLMKNDDSLIFIDKFKDEIDVMVDELFSSDKNFAGLLDYKVVKETTEKIRKNQVKDFINNLKEHPCNNLEEREEKEKLLKDEILEELIYELKNLFAEQYVKDKLYLYMHKDHGLHIALDNFKKMVLEESKNPLVISSTNKDIELLRKLFVVKKLEIVEDKIEKIEVDKNEIDKNKIDIEKLEVKKIEDEKEKENQEMLIKETIPNNNDNNDNNNEEVNIEQKPKKSNHSNNPTNDYQYHQYIKKFKFKILQPQPEKEFSFYYYIKKTLWRSIDKVLLIDLTSHNKKTKLNNIFELIFLSFYSNIEIFLVIAFIINHIIDASIMSMVYPISYFGYGLVEYPVSNKLYWKAMTVYSLVTITIKLVYQFPFFCGYPFLAVFNIFNDNYCEYYPLNEQEIAEGFEFILGLRKYNGEYSYPKNAGLLSGILGDIVIICLLLVMRSLLKSKGIWNFVNINKEFTKVPVFEYSKTINSNNNSEINSEQTSSYLSNLCKYWEENLTLFFKRLVPELFAKDNSIIYKPGVDYYPLSFAAMLTIIIYTLFFFGSLTGKSSQGIQDALDKQQFSKDLVWTVIILISITVLDRIIYKLRSINDEFIFEKFKKIEETNVYHISSLSNTNNINNLVRESNTVNNSRENLSNSNSNNNINVARESNSNNANNGPLPNSNRNNNLNSVEKDHIETSNLALMIKLIMHYSILIGAHILLFFVIPLSTRICFFNNNSLIFLYLLCCVYFYFSSKQIKYGFPLVTKGQYFADSTQLTNRILFKIYRNVPFLYELRAILDWTITKTSLDLFQFFKMECAYANLYEVKCDMDMRKARRMGEDRWWFEKVAWGFCSFIFLMFILILPMILFSSFNPNLVENKAIGGTFKINLELKSSDTPSITTYNLNLFDVNTLKINNLKDSSQYEYLKTYLVSQLDDLEERKIQKVKVVNYSQLDWILSPPAINALLKHLEKKTDCFVKIEWEFRREFPINNKNIMGEKSIKLSREQIATLRNIMFALKNHQKPEAYSLEIKDAFPKVIRLSNRQSKYIKFDPKHKTPHKENTDLTIQLIKENERDIYWKINQVDIKEVKNSPFYQKNDELTFLLINDDVISSFFGFNSDGSMPLSIIGIYATLVYTVGKFVRIFFDKISQRVIYEEMPEPNDLFELCEGIYIYRNQRKLKEENYLYDLLIRIYRSPETLIKITGTKVKYISDKPELNI